MYIFISLTDVDQKKVNNQLKRSTPRKKKVPVFRERETWQTKKIKDRKTADFQKVMINDDRF